MKILLTGGCGFIGSNLVRFLVLEKGCTVVNLDALTYAGNPASLADLAGHPNYHFERIDLADAQTGDRKQAAGDREQDSESLSPDPCSQKSLLEIFEHYRPSAVLHLAAESHVDRSIDGPGQFIQTNVVGTFNLLQASLAYWRSLEGDVPVAGSSSSLDSGLEPELRHKPDNSNDVKKSEIRFFGKRKLCSEERSDDKTGRGANRSNTEI